MKCKYCGEQAGFLRLEHEACRERHEAFLVAVTGAVRDAAVAGCGWDEIAGDVAARMQDGFVDGGRLPELVADGVEQVVDGTVFNFMKSEAPTRYFAGESHRFRICHDRIVSYTPMEDGVSLTRDRANARPEMFRTGDGWFTYNIVANAQNLEP